nr:hypothetical protein [Cystobacter fuscus]
MAALERHVERAEHQASVDVLAHGPTHHLAREKFQDYGQVGPALPRPT